MTNNLTPANDPRSNWKSQMYLIGAVGGALVGLLASYLYARAAEEEVGRGGRPRPVGTGELIGLSLTALGLIRQITELGRPSRKK